MRSLRAAALAATALCAGAAAAQQPTLPPSARPAAGATAGQAEMPAKQSANAQMSGPAETALERQTPLPAEKPAAPDAAATAAGNPADNVASAIIPGADPDAILALARAGGDARLVADEYGDPLIEAVAGKHPYTVAFFDCTRNRDCRSVMFRAGFRASGQSAGQMADWNRDERFGKAYLDAAGNPVVEFNLNLAGGVTRANLADSVDRWQGVLAAFAERVGY